MKELLRLHKRFLLLFSAFASGHYAVPVSIRPRAAYSTSVS